MKKISVNTVKAFLKEHKQSNTTTQSFAVGDSSFDVEIKTSLSIDEKTAFIKRVLSGCFDAKNNFRPEYVSPMLRATILQMCTNVPVISLKGEQAEDGGGLMDLEAMSELYMAMDLDHLPDPAYQSMMNDIVRLCGRAIDWRWGSIISGGSTDNAIRDLVGALTAKVNDLNVEDLLKYAGQLSDATKGLDEGGILNGLLRLHEEKK